MTRAIVIAITITVLRDTDWGRPRGCRGDAFKRESSVDGGRQHQHHHQSPALAPAFEACISYTTSAASNGGTLCLLAGCVLRGQQHELEMGW
ncbi:hypothetical protein CMUS01_09360 [Colletotrichum musicola]|uniref:Uncharacterized protein n=1 Tax=Colletotrichum musicola TaxID=2175873 RepID=A0A8H6K8T1_9PEZI|nr:hypothetical protein CMUS01_09360 [Colletotrichum musicola]